MTDYNLQKRDSASKQRPLLLASLTPYLDSQHLKEKIVFKLLLPYHVLHHQNLIKATLHTLLSKV